MHLAHGSQRVLEHLTLLYQMVFTCGLVPDSFCVGVVTPVLKKGKDPAQCGSHRPITVAPVFCKIFELLFIDELCRVCESPDNQFGFKQSVSREHVHHIICNVLLECDQTGERVIAASHDVRRAFDSGVHAQILSCALKRGLDRSIVLPLRNLYKKLKVRIKVPTIDGPQISAVVVPVEKGIRQGAVSSPTLYNNSVIESQKDVEMSLVFRGRDISLLNYADDILNLSRSFWMIEKNFDTLRNAYSEINLSFNESKSEIVVFNRQSSDDVPDIRLGNSVVRPAPSLVYLGLPIGCDVKSTRSLLVEHLTSKIRKSYGLLISTKTNYNRHIRARLFNALVQPHVIGLSPFWALLTDRNKRTIRSCFYRFCQVLVRPTTLD